MSGRTSGGPETTGTDWGVYTPRADLRKQAPTGEFAHRPGSVCISGGPKTTGTDWEVCNLERHETTGTGESANQGRPHKNTHSPEEGECLNLWVWGLLESWDEGCLSAGWDGEELG